MLALLVILAGLTWPALDGPIASLRLRKAADVVRAEWIRARVEAMSSGETFSFRCAAGSGQYTIASESAPECFAYDGSTAAPTDAVGSRDVSLLGAGEEKSLPEGVVFFADGLPPDMLASAGDADAADPTATSLLWSDPILFYPDGTTSTAQLQLRNQRDRMIELSLRGLTGTITVSEVQ